MAIFGSATNGNVGHPSVCSTSSGTMKPRRLPSRYGRYVMPLILTFLMTFAVAGISTWIAVESLSVFFLRSWMKSWMVSWAIAFPAMVMLMPVTQRIVALIVRRDQEDR